MALDLQRRARNETIELRDLRLVLGELGRVPFPLAAFHELAELKPCGRDASFTLATLRETEERLRLGIEAEALVELRAGAFDVAGFEELDGLSIQRVGATAIALSKCGALHRERGRDDEREEKWKGSLHGI